MKPDRFLTAILIGIALLVLVSLLVFFARGRTQTYQPENTPQGVVHNYLLALAEGDYQRAYGYLAEMPDKPSYDAFRSQLTNDDRSGDAGVEVGEVEIRPDGRAYVTLYLVYGPPDPFSGAYRNQRLAILAQQQGTWRLLQMPYEFWGFDWYPAESPAKP